MDFQLDSLKVLEALPLPILKEFIGGLYEYLTVYTPKLIDRLNERKDLTEDVKTALNRVIVDFFRKISSKREENA